MKWLNGRKTYIGAIAYGALGFAQSMSWITPEQYNIYLPIVLAWTGIAIKHSMDKRTKNGD